MTETRISCAPPPPANGKGQGLSGFFMIGGAHEHAARSRGNSGKRMNSFRETENRAGLARITCGWKKPELPLEWVRRYWRDVHSPAITRRAGIYDYRHSQYDAVDPALLGDANGVELHCPSDAQLMWTSDVRYRDAASLAAFDASPPPEVKPHLLGDIDLIVDKSTTYRAVGENASTYVDRTGDATPHGPPVLPTYALFLRQRSDQPAFRQCVRSLAELWADCGGVKRLRMSLFEVPDMEAERKAGYPIRTHPPEQQYQGLMDVVLSHKKVGRELPAIAGGIDFARYISTIHAYPVAAHYVSVYGGRPTIVGLRGYAAHRAIEALGAGNQKQAELLEWMYGPAAKDGPVAVNE